MKRLVITLGLLAAVTVPFGAASAATPVLPVMPESTVASILSQPITALVNGLTTTVSTLTTGPQTPAPSTGATTTTTTKTSIPTPAPVTAAASSTPSATSTTTSTSVSPTSVAAVESYASYLSATPTERISSYTYPSTKLSAIMTTRLEILAAAFAITGLMLVGGIYEATARLVAGIGVLGRKSVEEVR